VRPVAEDGYLVVILKEPFDLAIVQPGQSAGPIDDHPEVAPWVVGGHSLGGVTASAFAADNPVTVSGLLLWASYPARDISGATGLQVTSISGTNDQLATPADIQASRSSLPPDTDFVEIAGGIHGYFADYGEQSGDGTPGTDRDTASAEIVAASLALLDRVAASAPPA
jgi:pimeloyl-ACP methyl ester carboxylesterase